MRSSASWLTWRRGSPRPLRPPAGRVRASKVGDDRAEGFQTVRHRQAMQSLDNTYSEAELREFHARLVKLLGREDLSYVVEPKIDGLAVSVTYEKGKFVRAVTRGNGVEGDDVTANALTIKDPASVAQGVRGRARARPYRGPRRDLHDACGVPKDQRRARRRGRGALRQSPKPGRRHDQADRPARGGRAQAGGGALRGGSLRAREGGRGDTVGLPREGAAPGGFPTSRSSGRRTGSTRSGRRSGSSTASGRSSHTRPMGPS